MKTFAPLSLLLAVVVSFAASAAQAQVATSPPAIRIAQASHVSVASGQAFYTGSSAQPRSWSAPNPLIISAARRLQNNPDRIYEFVHNGIETEPVFGLVKGAAGTLVNRSGTPFEQTELMLKLLQAAGYAAQYRYGPITLTGAQFASWMGTTSATSAQEFLDDGGIPNDVSSVAGTLPQVTFLSVWSADIERANRGIEC